MSDLLAVILVGLVLLTAVVSIFAILTRSSEHYAEDDFPPSDSGNNALPNNKTVTPSRRAGDRGIGTSDTVPGRSTVSARAITSNRKRKEGLPS